MTRRTLPTLLRPGLLALLVALLLPAREARGALCGASVPSYAKVGETHVFGVPSYSCGTRPDPSWQLQRPDGSTISRTGFSFSYTFDQAGKWTWFVVGYTRTDCIACSDEGSISVEGAGCVVTVKAAVKPESPARSLSVDFSATATTTGPCETPTLSWTFGDGATATGNTARHSYATIDMYPWSVTAKASGTTGTASGTVGLPCLDVAGLPFCAGAIQQTKGTSGQEDSFLFSQGPSLSDLLFFDQSVTFKGSTYAGTGTVSWNGPIYAKVKGGSRETILTGNGLVYDLDVPRAQLLPRTVPSSYTLGIAGLPLLVDGKPITLGADYVEVTPTVFVGLTAPIKATLSSWEGTLRLPRGGPKGITGFRLLQGSLTPSITFLDISGTYDPDKDKLEGAFSVGFPFMGTWSLATAFRIEQGCFNGLDGTLGLPDPLPIGTTGLGLAGVTVKVNDICHPERILFLVGGDLGILVPPIPGEFFSINDVLAGYNAPYALVVKGGTAKLAGYPIANLEGKINFYNPLSISLKGGFNLGGVLTGDLQTAVIVSKPLWVGSLAATATIPDLQCDFTGFGCRAIRTALKSVTNLPVTVVGTTFDVYVDPKVAQFKGELTIGPLKTVEVLEVTGGQLTILVGRNYQDLYVLTIPTARGLSALATAERTVTIPADAPSPLIFAASAPSTVPDLVLTTPDGRTLTPASTDAGVRYGGDSAVQTAVYVVERPRAGTWRMSVSNVPGADTTFQVLGAVPPPELTFTSVVRSGNQVRVEASVARATAGTKVDFYWSRSGLHDGQAIATGLPASSGKVSATWDLTVLPAGPYFVYARVDDGLNAPRLVWFPQPVTISGALPAPTQLTGTFGGGVAVLSWKAPAGGVAGYTVRYTADTSLPGYPLEASVPFGESATISSLDPAKTYRFTVSAWNVRGEAGDMSVPWTTPGTPGCVLTCSATVPASGGTGSPLLFQATSGLTGCAGNAVYDWNFGDGQAHGSAASTSHTYSQAGTYAWTLTVTAAGRTCVRSGSITVTPAGGGGLPGDCDGDGTVTVDEVQRAANMFLGLDPPGCTVDANGDRRVTEDEVRRVVDAYLGARP